VRPPSDLEGVLQDVHWAVGMFGYFPTYTIGSLYAAQLIETYSRKNDLNAEIRAGQFGPLRNWLAKNIYERGNRASGDDIIKKATGSGLDTAAYFAHVSSPERAWN
jgi:carboxypeptidase Taq